jgi:hypothetical protein
VFYDRNHSGRQLRDHNNDVALHLVAPSIADSLAVSN